LTATLPHLPASPRAEVYPVEDLVRFVREGRLRIPPFQRGWKWRGEQVRDLFDSLYRGYPIGSLLLWARPAEADALTIGPVGLTVPARHDAWSVVDGQQRLTALVGALLRPAAATDDDFAVWFDPSRPERPFQPSPNGSPPPAEWVPVTVLLDRAALMDFCRIEPRFQQDQPLRQLVFEAGKRLREYRVPIYLVEAEDDFDVREIFRRTNRSGTQMAEAEVFNSYTGRSRERPSRVEDLAAIPLDLQLGEMAPPKLLQCVMALLGLDVTRRLDDQGDHGPSSAAYAEGLSQTAPALRSALVFLLRDAHIPHLQLLPYPAPLVVLTRLFHLHPEPNERSRLLLARWVWRGMLTRAHAHGERTLLRRAVEAVRVDEEGSVQRLLALVPSSAPPAPWWLDANFDARSAASRIAALGLALLGPLDPTTGEPLDVPAALNTHGADALRKLVPTDAARSAANRALLPSGAAARLLPAAPAPVLRSHAIDDACGAALRACEWDEALRLRRATLLTVVEQQAALRAAWGRSDRPSIAHLLADEGDA
jgi:hypothetical protein